MVEQDEFMALLKDSLIELLESENLRVEEEFQVGFHPQVCALAFRFSNLLHLNDSLYGNGSLIMVAISSIRL